MIFLEEEEGLVYLYPASDDPPLSLEHPLFFETHTEALAFARQEHPEFEIGLV